jgi:predicted Zn finger-like uncharacterized protein
MDVRCEKCHTEYELEESKVTEAGVTVKCTSCGNLFKIKRKSAGPPARLPEPLDIDRSPGMWLIRSPGGDNRRFRELTTLQQWIVERKVTRECEISRTGETWKKLGDIAELGAFFAIVDQAQAAARVPQAGDRKSTQPFASSTVPPARAPSVNASPVPTPPPLPLPLQAEPLELEPDPPSNPYLPPASAYESVPVAPPPSLPPASFAGSAAGPSVLSDRPRNVPTAQVRKPEPTRRDSWAGAAVAPADAEGEPAWAQKPISGPIPGAGDEPALGKHARTVRVDPAPFGDAGMSDIDLLRQSRGSRAWMWIVGAVLVGGAAAAFLLLRPSPAASIAAPLGGVDAGPAAVARAGVDGGAAAAAADETGKKLQDALAHLGEDTDEGFAAAAKLLDQTHVADEAVDARLRAAQALTESTWAQALFDDATAASNGAAQLRAEADRHVLRAGRIAREASAKAARDPEVAVALADALRLERKPAEEVDRTLAPAGEAPEALHVRGLLRVRDGKPTEAHDLFEKAIAGKAREGAELLRARYQLALLAVAAKQPEVARRELDAILAAQAGHARAKALRAKLDADAASVAKPGEPPGQPATAVAAAKPVEPSTAAPGGKPAAPAAKPVDDPGAGPLTAGAYDGLVAKGNKQAENGDCAGAVKSFERALDARPGGVEALTGLGYCYLDRRQYSQALSNFRAALGISSRYSEALIGIAEAYRYQNMPDQAAIYYRRYLEASPTGSKAAMAKRQLDALGGSAAKPPETPAPTAPPPPAVAPPLDQLPDKPGTSSEPKPAPPPEEKLPEKPEKPEKPAEPPPPPPAAAEHAGEPAPPDTPH